MDRIISLPQHDAGFSVSKIRGQAPRDAAVNLVEFERFTAHKHLLDELFGSAVFYDPLPGKKACRIHIDRNNADVLDTDSHAELIIWFAPQRRSSAP